MSAPKVRDLHIDGLRGLAVILVVLGHAAVNPHFHEAYASGRIAYGGSWFDTAAFWNPIYNLTYSFHMPLFAFVSGIVAGWSTRPPIDMLKQRFLSLMVPYFAWAAIAAVAGAVTGATPLGFSGYAWRAWQIVTNPNTPGAAWFLYALFVCFLLLAAAEATPWPRSVLGFEAVLVILFSCTPWGGLDWVGAGHVAAIFPFFALGYLVNSVPDAVKKRRGQLLWVSAVGYAAIMCATYPIVRLDLNGWYVSASAWLHAHHLPGAFISQRLLVYTCALLGVLTCYLGFGFVRGQVLAAFTWFGRRALGIYLTQGLVLGPLILKGLDSTLVLFLLTLAGSSAITVLLEQTPWTRRVLLGIRNKPLPAFANAPG